MDLAYLACLAVAGGGLALFTVAFFFTVFWVFVFEPHDSEPDNRIGLCLLSTMAAGLLTGFIGGIAGGVTAFVDCFV